MYLYIVLNNPKSPINVFNIKSTIAWLHRVDQWEIIQFVDWNTFFLFNIFDEALIQHSVYYYYYFLRFKLFRAVYIWMYFYILPLLLLLSINPFIFEARRDISYLLVKRKLNVFFFLQLLYKSLVGLSNWNNIVYSLLWE